MTVALAIGLSVVQKSLIDISTASKVEQSSRAFSAAEAGIEKALKGDTALQEFIDNSSKITNITDTGLIPQVAADGVRQSALEFPPFAKEDVVQVWLADYKSTSNPPPVFYNPPSNSLDVYWGTNNAPATDQAAIELTTVYYDKIYKSVKWYLDSSALRASTNGFQTVDQPAGNCNNSNTPVGSLSSYQCKITLDYSNRIPEAIPSPVLMLVRARLLYNITSQPLAVQAVGTCGSRCSLPSQAREIISTGVSGETQRRVKLFQLDKVVPPYFDYAIFSAGPINK